MAPAKSTIKNSTAVIVRGVMTRHKNALINNIIAKPPSPVLLRNKRKASPTKDLTTTKVKRSALGNITNVHVALCNFSFINTFNLIHNHE